jgi:NADH:ubiquinone oxidoreductase subunit E
MNIMVCGGTGCLSSDSDKVIKNLELILKAADMEKSKRYTHRLFWILRAGSYCKS